MPVKIFQLTLASLLFAALVACHGAREQRAHPSSDGAPAPAPTAPSSRSEPAGVPSVTSRALAPAPASTPPSGAYAGCGQPLPVERLWDETAEAAVLDAIGAAQSCAAAHGRRVLLEFVAPWCDDCQEMTQLDATSVVARVLRERFERVRVNVGKWDRHAALRESFDVRALATYVVLDPKTSAVLAKTTLEPITKPGQKLSADDWARWLSQH